MQIITLDTNSRQSQQAKLAQGSPQYKARDWRLHGGNVHQDISRPYRFPYMAWAARKLSRDIDDTTDGKTAGIQGAFFVAC